MVGAVILGSADAATPVDPVIELNETASGFDLKDITVATVEIRGEGGFVGRPLIWHPGTGRVTRLRAAAVGDGCEVADPVVLLRDSIAFTCWYGVSSGNEVSIFVSRKGDGVPVLVAEGWEDRRDAYNLNGEGALLVFNSGHDAKVWRVTPTRGGGRCPNVTARRCRLIARGTVVGDVADGLIAGWSTGTLVLLDAAGRLVRRLPIARSEATDLQLTNRRAYVVRRGVLSWYSLADGRRLGQRRLYPRAARIAEFAGAASGYAAYLLSERLFVVRLRDGRRREIARPIAGSFFGGARLAERGIVYRYGRVVREGDPDPDLHDTLGWRPIRSVAAMFHR